MIERDLYVEQLAVPVRIDLPQGTNIQQIKFSFRDLKPEGDVRIYIKKPSGAEIYNDASQTSLNSDIPYAIFDTTTQMTAEAGQMQGQVRVTDSGDKILNSFPITLNIIESPVSGNAIESKDELTALDNALSAEQGRASAESTREQHETTREQNESTRQTQESTRESNEQTRQSNETLRQTWYNTTKSAIDNASFTIGEVTTGSPSTPASASISGEPFNQTLNLTIPKGEKGDKGDGGGAATLATAATPGIIYPGDGLSVMADGKLIPKTDMTLGINTGSAVGGEGLLGVNIGAGLSSSSSSGVYVNYDDTMQIKDGKLSVASGLSSFIGTGRTYYTTGDPMTVTVDVSNQQIVAPCTIINPTTGVIVVDDGM